MRPSLRHKQSCRVAEDRHNEGLKQALAGACFQTSRLFKRSVEGREDSQTVTYCLKITQNVLFLIFGSLAFSTNFCHFKSDLSGNTV